MSPAKEEYKCQLSKRCRTDASPVLRVLPHTPLQQHVRIISAWRLPRADDVLRFREGAGDLEQHWCPPPAEDIWKQWADGTDGLAARLPMKSEEHWRVWCFCGKEMVLHMVEEASRLEVDCFCHTCGKFAQRGVRFFAAGDAFWQCISCGAFERTKSAASAEPMGKPGCQQLRMLREHGHALIDCARGAIGKAAVYDALGQDFHFGDTGLAKTIDAIWRLRRAMPKEASKDQSLLSQQRVLLRLQDDDAGMAALSTALAGALSREVAEALLFGYACAGHSRLIAALLDSGGSCDVNSRRRKDGCSALHCARFHGRDEAAAVLLARGADPSLRNAAGEMPSDVQKQARLRRLDASVTFLA
eukprot:CAMPEP_0179185860 /NCGR_PEP_ID=MMETSP0796-20121207/92170_1 /TAXON_ID=73915 /ORGANISM="Pyrodinium bahamense, Strain pbaha01" /LENGTH=358 /DNA_ID=CAMNT_0020889829 /DNA_START=6 /DNA_END=1079 /DNA_ORIENTATION=-